MFFFYLFRELEALFGKGFWDHVTLGVSKWAYDELSVENRNRTGKTESWWIGEKNKQLQARFHVKRDTEEFVPAKRQKLLFRVFLNQR